MQIVKVTGEYTIIKKRSGRYGVRRSNKTWINGSEKAEILAKEGLVKLAAPAPASEKTEEVSETTEEASTEEAQA